MDYCAVDISQRWPYRNNVKYKRFYQATHMLNHPFYVPVVQLGHNVVIWLSHLNLRTGRSVDSFPYQRFST